LAAVTSACGGAEDAGGEDLNVIDISDPGSALTAEQLEDLDGDFRQIRQNYSVSSCATASRNVAFTGDIDPEHVSPRSYNTCTKGYVVDLNDISEDYVGNYASIDIEYADTDITSRAVCERTELRAIIYTQKISTNNWNATSGVFDSDRRYGYWNNFNGIYYCDLSIRVTGMSEGQDLRFALTSRDTGATRKVAIETNENIILH
jgi:hypothetical protein